MSWTREQAALLRTFLRTGFRRTVLWCGLGMAAAGVLAVCFGGPLVSWYLGLF